MNRRDSTLLWLLMSQWPGISRKALRGLLSLVPEPCQILALDDSDCLSAGVQSSWLQARNDYLRGLASPLQERAVHQCESLKALGGYLVCLGAADYPALLAEIPDPPPGLFYCGDASLLASPQIAMVGSRHATRAGLELAESFAAELAQRGLCISSGLAYGVDAASHRGALRVQGKTIAVLGTGLDVVYPRRNEGLYQQIATEGLLVSEFPPGSPPRREQFPQRNRVISGLSLGVLVVEAAVRSGSLITARFALEQGREVFAIPGSIHNPQARGCHRLIREGACLVESVEDIVQAWVAWLPAALEDLPAGSARAPSHPEHLSEHEQRLLAALGFEPWPLDLLAQSLGMSVDKLLPGLLELQMEGWVEQQGPCWLRCR